MSFSANRESRPFRRGSRPTTEAVGGIDAIIWFGATSDQRIEDVKTGTIVYLRLIARQVSHWRPGNCEPLSHRAAFPRFSRSRRLGPSPTPGYRQGHQSGSRAHRRTLRSVYRLAGWEPAYPAP